MHSALSTAIYTAICIVLLYLNSSLQSSLQSALHSALHTTIYNVLSSELFTALYTAHFTPYSALHTLHWTLPCRLHFNMLQTTAWVLTSALQWVKPCPLRSSVSCAIPRDVQPKVQWEGLHPDCGDAGPEALTTISVTVEEICPGPPAGLTTHNFGLHTKHCTLPNAN